MYNAHSSCFSTKTGLYLIFCLFYFNFYSAQNIEITKKKQFGSSPVNAQHTIKCSIIELMFEKSIAQFIRYSNILYLILVEKDTLKIPSIEKFKLELEALSGTKFYYKKEWSIFLEYNRLFFVLLLPFNYLKIFLHKMK